ncbi:glutathione S-transferase T3-like [Humulus lupulus]|uniref:glutathione S-transferase T3-like n=1 Tax=Humulus lupulus TaxID=3486 RepID=UPI002B40CC81|nr:glutathione S-transferase T3-like [Humulus lupulus]
MSSSRTASYSLEEDMHLCHVYIDISQDPIIGRNQSGNSFWARVESEYHKNGKFSNQPRPRRSLQTRMTTIIGAVAKLRGCINQIQNKNPSGASQEDIKFTSDDNINAPSRFQQDGPNFTSSKSSSHNFDSPTSASTGMSSFDLNINNEEIITNLTERPIGVKKAKAKQLGDDQFNKLMEQSKKLVQVIEKSNTDRNERHKRKTEDKILFTDLDSISNPEFRQYIQSEKRRIYRERARTSEVGEQGE